MNDYPLYDVPSCNSFADFLRHIESNYDVYPAFKIDDIEFTYKDFVGYVRTLIPILSASRAEAFVLSIENPMLFSVSLFASVMVGKIAILCDIASAKKMNSGLTIEELDEKTITQFLSTKSTHPADILPYIVANDGVSIIAFSSGTTGYAKGVGLSQLNILSDMVSCMRYSKYEQGDVFYHVIPNQHLFGCVGDILIPLYAGGLVCFATNKLSFFESLRHYKPTVLNLPPALVEAICRLLRSSIAIDKVTGGHLKKIICGGAQTNMDDCTLLSEYGVKVITAYGLTECSPCISLNRDRFLKLNSSGKVLPCCKVKIVEGEIFVSGQNVMIGYFADSEATESVFVDGWLKTGDLGEIDEDGFLYIKGRKNNLIVFEDGTKIIADEVENLICSIDGVEECIVRETCVKNRVRFNVDFVQSSSEASVDEVKIIILETLNKQGLLSKLNDLSLVNGPLLRNALGKLVRKTV